MHLLMECARLVTLCAGEGELSEGRWQQALALNAARVARVGAGGGGVGGGGGGARVDTPGPRAAGSDM